MRALTFWRQILVLWLLASLVLGCKNDVASTKLTKAEIELDKVLDAWARGEPADQYPDVDPDWKAGYKLHSFLSSDARLVETKPEQARVEVALSLSDPKGKRLQKTVVYRVEQGPPVVIRRESVR
ncbi:MAG: hypothetical protein NZO58_13845 [Gemmataceae bacterium]|nr:hypothetical protein [Gemmataceae bacterium]